MADPTFTDIDKLGLSARDHFSFTLNDDNYVARRVTGKFDATPAGLRTDWRTTTQDVSTSAIKLPATALSDRNAISIHNLDSSATLYLGKDNTVTANSVDGITSGWEIPPGGKFNTDITQLIELYGISTTTIKIKILEIS